MTSVTVRETRRIWCLGIKHARHSAIAYAKEGWAPEGFTTDTIDIWFYWHWQEYGERGTILVLHRETTLP